MAVIWFLFLLTCACASNVAFLKPYNLSEPGFSDVLYTNEDGNAYAYKHEYNPDLLDTLTRNTGITVAEYGLLWHHSDGFNVTITLDTEKQTSPVRAVLQGNCCNMGIHAPIAMYLYISNNTLDWALIGVKKPMTLDQTAATPATRYRFFMNISTSVTARYFRYNVTGTANKFLSISTLELYE